MTNSTRSRPTSSARTRTTPPSRRAWPWIALGLVVVLAATITAVASDHSDQSNQSAPAGVEQTRSVEVTGAALAPLGDGLDPSIGEPIPTVKGASFDGTPVTIGHDGTPRIIAFVAHWCPHCQREVPRLSDYLTSNQLPDGVELVTVATATSPDRPNYPPSSWLEQEKWPGPVLADSTDSAAGTAFGLTAFPYFVAVDDAGNVVERTSGEISTEQFAALAQAAAG